MKDIINNILSIIIIIINTENYLHYMHRILNFPQQHSVALIFDFINKSCRQCTRWFSYRSHPHNKII